MNWDDLNYEKSYSAFDCYGQSKLAQVLFTIELEKRLKGLLSNSPNIFINFTTEKTNCKTSKVPACVQCRCIQAWLRLKSGVKEKTRARA